MSKAITYDVSKYPVLSAFIQNQDHNVIGIRGPFGSGKSVACCMKILKCAQEMPKGKDGKRRSKWLVVRNSYRELEDTTIRTWLEWVPESVFGIFKRQAKIHEVRFNDVELDVMFRSLDTDDDVRKILSLEITGAWINEAREIPWVIMKNIQGRLGRFPRQSEVPEGYWTGIIMDTNSPDMEHWWYQFAEVDTPKGFKFYSQPGGMEPNAENRFNLPAGYYERMQQGADEEWIKVHVHNQYGFILEGRPVYPEYRDSIHCSNDVAPIRGLDIIRGWDFGLTPACVFLQIDPKGKVLVFDELTSDDMGIDRFSDVVIQYSKQKFPGFRFQDFGDPAGMAKAQTDEKTCFQILHTKNIWIESGKQDPTIRIESVKKALNTMVEGKPGFLLSPKCKTLRKGFMGGYQYKKLKISGWAKFQDKPDKNQFSHVHDALQYPMTILYGATLVDPDFSFDDDEREVYEEYNDFSSGRSAVTGY